jgi:hypothetical protein
MRVLSNYKQGQIDYSLQNVKHAWLMSGGARCGGAILVVFSPAIVVLV